MTQELETLREEVAKLRSSRDFYQSVFENTPVALMEENFSAVKISFDNLRANGVQDFQAYFAAQPDAIKQHYELIYKEVTINKAFVLLYKASSAEELESQLDDIVLTEHSLEALQACFVAFANGEPRFSTKTCDSAVDGSPVEAYVTWVIAEGYQDTWERIVVSVIPLQQMADILASAEG